MVFTDCRVLCRFIPTLRVSIHGIFTLVQETVLTDPFVVFLAERSCSWIESLRTGTGLSGSMKVIPPELCQSLIVFVALIYQINTRDITGVPVDPCPFVDFFSWLLLIAQHANVRKREKIHIGDVDITLG